METTDTSGKRIVVSFTEEELKQLSDLVDNLTHVPKHRELVREYPDLVLRAEDINQLLNNNPVAQNMWFINIYVVNKQYGGPEEGGWYYDTYDCIKSYGHSCLEQEVSVRIDGKVVPWRSFNEMVEDFISYCEFYEVKPPFTDMYDYAAYEELLNEGRTITASDIDRHGEGILLSIERAPGQRHMTWRHHYE